MQRRAGWATLTGTEDSHAEGRRNFDPGGQGTVQTGRGSPHAQHQASRQDGGEDRGPGRVRGSGPTLENLDQDSNVRQSEAKGKVRLERSLKQTVFT